MFYPKCWKYARVDLVSRTDRGRTALYSVPSRSGGAGTGFRNPVQCPEGFVWDNLVFQLNEIISSAVLDYPVDRRKVSLTGLSMGGFGAWAYAITVPRLFYRLAPICGGGMSWRAPALLKIPVWAFHGDADTEVPPVYSQLMVERLNQAGGDAVLTMLPGVGHNAWDPAYLQTDLIQWLLGEDVERR